MKMLFKILLTAGMIPTANIAMADDDLTISAMIGETGIEATLNQLSSKEQRTDAEQFALGGLTFLRGIERALQEQARYNLNLDIALPLMRTSLPYNPEGAAPPADLIRSIFSEGAQDMHLARSRLSEVEREFSLLLDLNDIWFDIDDDGLRHPAESLGPLLGINRLEWSQDIDAFINPPALEVRFDGSDLHWLAAYTHLIEGTANVVLAYDPTAAVVDLQGFYAERAVFETILTDRDLEWMTFFLDQIATLIDALEQRPDPIHLEAARLHFLDMVSANVLFWDAVNAETDNDREFIPNDEQTSALGIPFPEGTGEHWMAVLSDAQAVLEGELLIPFYRFHPDYGINLKRLVEDAPQLNLAHMIQGRAFLPWIEKGPTVSDTSWRDFERLMGPLGGRMGILLN